MNGTADRAPAAPPANDVASPCISVCVMDAGSGFCIGCWRTLDEIAAWSVLDADAKRAVLAAICERRARSASANDR
ncbi:MAG TPA: DUF1289 domain-containing protein [Casimicrobiaceae bacterium]|nr:DUF1289 domain-containing protein [Casimicrobiaceae bacterium]